MSNPAMLHPTGPGGRVNETDKIINLATENLFTEPDRSCRFHCNLTNGQNHSFPDVLPFPNFPRFFVTFADHVIEHVRTSFL